MSVVLTQCIQLSCHFSNAVFSLTHIQTRDFWWKHSGLVGVSIPWSRQLPFQLKLGIFLPLSVPAGSHSYVDTEWRWCTDGCLSHSPTSGMRTSLARQEALYLKEWFSRGLWSGFVFPRESTAANLGTVNEVVLKANYMAETWLWRPVKTVLVEILNMGKKCGYIVQRCFA